MCSVRSCVIVETKKKEMNKMCGASYSSGWIAQFNSLYPFTVCDTTKPEIHMAKCNVEYDPLQILRCFNAVTLPECDGYEKDLIYNDNHPSLIYIEIAKYLEEEYDCAGLCNVCPHFMYTDCNRGPVKEGCDEILFDLIKCKDAG